MMRLFITGAAGQLGSAIVGQFHDCELVRPTSRELDITDGVALRRAVLETEPDVIVNCAAYNNVDGAEDRPQDAFALNSFAVRTLARAAEDAGATLVHYGSDFIFDGTASAPYDESAQPSPRSKYGASKLLGEWFALEAPRSFVLRVESLFGTPRSFTGRRGSMDGIVKGLEEGREIPVFTDRVITPGYVVDIAAATRHLVESAATPGVYHCTNAGAARWTDIANELASQLGVEPRLKLVASSEVALKARRPMYSALAVEKLARAGFPMPDWRDALKRWLAMRDTPRAAASAQP
jgi:dTDP-4-dehydrorhamnose reductase